MKLAYAHGGFDHSVSPAHLSLTDWAFDPVFLVPLAIALLYFRGYGRYRLRGGHRFPLWRPLLFMVGLAVVGTVLMSPIALLAEISFTWHMVQHDLLLLLGLPLLLLGAPFIPVIRGLPEGFRLRVFAPLARHGAVRGTLRTVTKPVVALALYELNFLAWHFPAMYDWALRSDGAHYLMHASFVGTGLCLWWNLVTPYPFPSALHHLLRALIIFATAVVNGALSALIVFSDTVLYAYRLQPGFWGVTMLDDQVIGSGLMWVMGGMLRLGAIITILAVYAHEENLKEPGIAAARARRAGRLAGSA